jgi:fibronectin-binding autotransporter adhesin
MGEFAMGLKQNSKKNAPVIVAAAAAVAGLAASQVRGQSVVDYTSSPITQSFTGMSNTPTNFPTSGSVDLSNPDWGSSSMTGWYYQGASKDVYEVETSGGSASTGGLYSYGPSGGVETALGMQDTTTTGDETLAVELINTSGATLNSFTVTFDEAVYHYGDSSGASQTVNFEYDVTSAPATSTIATSNLNNVGALDYTASNPNPDSFSSTGQYENGVDPAMKNATVYGTGGALGWAPNDALWLEWITTAPTQLPGIGLSSFNFTAAAGAQGGLAVTWAKSSGTWDGMTANWTGGGTIYADPDTVTFANSLTANSTVTVQGAGVSPGSMTINNTTAFKYTFSGGSINGSGYLTNTAGTTELSASNGYSGGTYINGGTLIADNDSTLGSAGVGINFAGGTLEAGGAITSTRSIAVNTGGGTFLPNGFDSQTSGGATIGDVFNVNGTGTLEIDGAVSFTTGSPGALNIGSDGSQPTVILGASGTISQINNSTYEGKLVVTGTPRLNVDANSTISGAGEIDITNPGTLQNVMTTGSTMVTYSTYDTGVAITNASGDPGGTIDVPIHLNSTGMSFTAADVTNPNPSCVGTFTASIGGTKGGTIDIAGEISGNSDLNIANAPNGGGGIGTTILGAVNDYTGTTLINTNGSVLLAVPGAIPAGSDVIFGTISGAEGATTEVDLDGTTQTWASLSSGEFGHAADESISNNYSFNSATLVIDGSISPANKFKGSISDGLGGISLVKDGTNTIGLSGTNTYSGGTTLNNGTITASNDDNIGNLTSGLTFDGGTLGVTGSLLSPFLSSRPITVNAGGGTIDVAATTSYTLTASPAISWGGTLNFTDTGLAVITQTSGTISVAAGSTLNVAAGANLTVSGNGGYTDPFTDNTGGPTNGNHVAVVNNGSLTVNGGLNSTVAGITGTGTLTIGDGINTNTLALANNGAPSSVGSLSILGNSALDIGNNKLIISYSSPATDPIASIEQWIANGFYGTPGPQIISSSIASDDAASGLSYGIGYADGADGVVANLPSGEIEIMFTLLGDANLDGTVNSDDFSQFSHNLGQTGVMWDDGDFNYDGTVNSEDFSSFSHNQGQTASLASQTAGPLELANGISLANVPEPASMGLLTLAGVGMLARRRRQRAS